jgi:hypothetical protein
VVEEALGVVNEVLIAIVSGAVGLLGGGYVGYAFGVLRTLGERRNERRDNALAEIFKEMSLFYRGLVAWTDDPDPNPNKPSMVSDVSVREYANGRYREFTRTFYGNAIWLGKDTQDLIEGFVKASRIVLNEVNLMRADGSLPAGKNAKDLREGLSPKFYEVQKKLRAEVEASRDIIPHIGIGKNAVEQRGRGSGEGG